MPATDTGLQLALELLGVFAFALSGGLVAVRRGLDLVGVVVLAWVAGLGGGIIRDVLIGDVPPVGISDWRLVAVAVAAGLLTFTAHGRVRVVAARTRGLRLGLVTRTVQALDAVGLAVFCVGGSVKALSLGVAPLPAVVVGVITAVGGGLLRDLLAGQVPEVLRRELYAVPALLGATGVVTAHAVGALTDLVLAGSVILVFVIRIVAVGLGLNAPTRLRTGEH
ncbi:trimeric intracellular cation channel family protein [Ornithinicoccus halotolerans]|uniref:trimeric intracellular cation channel family protein n=1 Tax=Ornithinicoccus halotolerans TaxID=1748220 RepID=UPI001297351D|nr:trimeric intracellular cation channel family protein [Ornithinicoccus halotolerans]